MTGAVAASDTAHRRRELGDFLKTRRARLSPQEVGLPDSGRRRTPGLRREEVAMMADVGVAWYTWLEQGREINASAQLLERLSQALRLTDDERAYLFAVALRQTPLPPEPETEIVGESLQRILDHQGYCPAYVTGRRWDVLAWNRAAVDVFRDFGAEWGNERNSIWSMFMNPEQRRLILDWEGIAQRMLAQFRVDAGRRPGDTDLQCLVETLLKESPEFRAWWPLHDVQGRRDGLKELNHPLAGLLSLEHSVFRVNDAAHMQLIIYMPVDEATAEKLREMEAKSCSA